MGTVLVARRTRTQREPSDGPHEAGTGLLASVVGLAMFLALLMGAVQVLADLHTTSVMSAIGFDAARSVAAASETEASATAEARGSLGSNGPKVEFEWSGSDRDWVRLRVTMQRPSRLLFGLRGPGTVRIERTFVVRRELFR